MSLNPVGYELWLMYKQALKAPLQQNMAIPTLLSQASHYVCEFREYYPSVQRQRVFNCLFDVCFLM